MNIIVFDTETTGLSRYNSPLTDPSQPHLVQLSALQIQSDPLRVIQSLSLIVAPDDWEIPEAASAVHGISTETAMAFGQSEQTVLEQFIHLWAGDHSKDEPLLVVSHNAKFDKHIIACAIARAYGNNLLLKLWLDAPSYCTMEKAKHVVQAKNSRGALKWPKLSEAYEYFFNEQFDNQHSANADTVATMQIYFALQQMGV